MRYFFIAAFVLFSATAFSQDSTVEVENKAITLTPVVVRSNLDVPGFINRIQNDTSFYKAFRNLRVLGFDNISDIRMLNKKGSPEAYLRSRTRQLRKDGCRTMEVVSEEKMGDVWDYYTSQMYASLFYTRGQVCGETNIVKGHELSTKDKRGMDKHREQLKMLFFDPGRRIPGLPYIGKRTAIYDPEIARLYNMEVDMEENGGQNCFVFKQTVKPGNEADVAIREMTTWFNAQTMDIVARNYHLIYDAGVYDFDVSMEVQMMQFGTLTVPQVMRYSGNWKVILKKRERGEFTAVLSNFKNEN